MCPRCLKRSLGRLENFSDLVASRKRLHYRQCCRLQRDPVSRHRRFGSILRHAARVARMKLMRALLLMSAYASTFPNEFHKIHTHTHIHTRKRGGGRVQSGDCARQSSRFKPRLRDNYAYATSCSAVVYLDFYRACTVVSTMIVSIITIRGEPYGDGQFKRAHECVRVCACGLFLRALCIPR